MSSTMFARVLNERELKYIATAETKVKYISLYDNNIKVMVNCQAFALICDIFSYSSTD